MKVGNIHVVLNNDINLKWYFKEDNNMDIACFNYNKIIF